MSLSKTTNQSFLSRTQEHWRDSAQNKLKTQFIPFVNERDGVGRLLPIQSLNAAAPQKRRQDSEVYLAMHSIKNKFFEVEGSHRKHSSAPKLTRLKASLQNYLTRDHHQARDVFFDETENANRLGETTLLSSRKAKYTNNVSANAIYKKMPNYSFSKSVKKTVIDEAIAKYRNKDLDFIDVSRAHDRLNRRSSYIPEYSKMARPKNADDSKREISHGYLMKILHFQDKENFAR